MGRGDKKTAKGKRFLGSFGKSRPHKVKSTTTASTKKTTAVKPVAAPKEPAAPKAPKAEKAPKAKA
ncbi:MAG: 30S ribosomal protein THX, partial [Chitinophagia bacterium]|jgi:30S ribosomal protein S31